MISPTAEYALRAVVAIAQANGDAAATRWIAKVTKVPPGYLPKVLQMLGRAGLVASRRGLGGGFRLAKPADELTVLDVINAVDPFKRIEQCPLGLESHGGKLCPLHKRLDEAAEHVERSFATTTIGELLDQPHRSTPFCETYEQRLVGVPLGKGSPTSTAGAVTSRQHEALVEFSRDHTLGLAVAKHLVESADKQTADRRAALQDLVTAWREGLAEHFAREEQFLLPLMGNEKDAQRLQKEHAALRAHADLARVFVSTDNIDPTWLRGAGKLLHDHIRWAERELFPSVEQSAPADELLRMARELAGERSAASPKPKDEDPADPDKEAMS